MENKWQSRSNVAGREESSPRSRGCSIPGGDLEVRAGSSPRSRGCSDVVADRGVGAHVLPAQPGMLRSGPAPNWSVGCPPRAAGDAPSALKSARKDYPSSPRSRGCSVERGGKDRLDRVLPAQPGMLRTATMPVPRRSSPPRAAGDAPSSPQCRRCSPTVLPAQPGMLRPATAHPGCSWCPPRAAGDAPVVQHRLHQVRRSSPRSRGCSGVLAVPGRADRVLPAQPGMLRDSGRPLHGRGGPPRAAGDAPFKRLAEADLSTSSPRSRGCSVGERARRDRTVVLPAQPGMLRPSGLADPSP